MFQFLLGVIWFRRILFYLMAILLFNIVSFFIFLAIKIDLKNMKKNSNELYYIPWSCTAAVYASLALQCE